MMEHFEIILLIVAEMTSGRKQIERLDYDQSSVIYASRSVLVIVARASLCVYESCDVLKFLICIAARSAAAHAAIGMS